MLTESFPSEEEVETREAVDGHKMGSDEAYNFVFKGESVGCDTQVSIPKGLRYCVWNSSGQPCLSMHTSLFIISLAGAYIEKEGIVVPLEGMVASK